MSKVRMFIIEDDFIHANRLEMYLDEMGYESVGSATNAGEALNMIAATKPDMVLADIHLAGDRDGIELVEKLNQSNPLPVIFITSYRDSETFERAKQTNPYAYILKPYDKETLQTAIELAVFKFTQTTETVEINSDSSSWKEDQLVKDSVFLKVAGKLVKVNINEIHYVEVKDKMCLIGAGDDQFEVRISMGKLEQKLPVKQFLRIHRSFIINTEAIQEIDLSKSEVLVNNVRVPIGRQYKEAFINSLDTLKE